MAVNWNLLRLVVRARALSISRSTTAIAAAEPGWFLFVAIALVGGGAAAIVQLEPRRQTMVLGGMAVTLTLLLSVARQDARLHRIIGIAPAPVRVTEALLWSCPLIALAAMRSLGGSAVIAMVVAATALLSAHLGWSSRSRGARRVVRFVPTSLPEWTVGLRPSAPFIAVALVAGIVGSRSPALVLLVMTALCLTTSAFFWAPAEGWLLIHARGEPANRFLSRKLLASIAMLSALVMPIVLLGVLRAPQYGPAYLVALVVCMHAHAAAVVAKYASYQEGRPLDAAGSVVWTITALAILVPPVGILMLLWLYRRATDRIAEYCLVSPRAAGAHRALPV